ncbi:putative Fe-Mo cluster-binding NifX family protein [Thermovibrio guaymasensis]|uniref:Putative Fe-Mo cluster-binding NifX family protein n=1 Tax=Thermovibrio guaymasensis TaxID=240167 RepID=A0A420W7S7_9BACT|nr:NifB/NifX family molybdenum-iron cluster-binding protein [Thermovibrio guaymasensis]RKQ63367.1 putative Fe-Mo cluster-binding NifX family protein [Thermovibrio guaymasensis]
MKVAVPLEGSSGLDSPVCEHFGRAPYFALITVKDGEVEVDIFENPIVEHSAGAIPQMLAEQGVNRVIATRIGEKARAFFNQLGIDVTTGVTGTLRDVVDMLKGE